MPTLTNEIRSALKQFADRLPSTRTVERAPRLGAELTKKYGGKLSKPDGSPLDPKQRYFIGSAEVAINHLKKLAHAYTVGGMPAVVAYLRPYEAFLGTPDTEAAAPTAEAGPCVGCPATCHGPTTCKGPTPRAAEGFPQGALETL